MIKVTNLNKYFYKNKSNEIHVINNVSFEFPKTGLITILGESGCGKTTLMNVIGGLDNFHSGNIQIDEFNINKFCTRKIDRIRNEKIGYIFQNYLLLPQRTVYDNLILVLNMYNISLAEKNERIDYVLDAVGMLKYKKKNVSELSGGQQQRIAIARALIKSPSLILADEPTGNLDEKNTIQIMNIIKKVSQNTLVILVSHEKNIATSYSDYIIQIESGKIINQSDIKSSTLYQYEDDQNIYLKEYQYHNIKNDNISIDFYSNENTKINLKIVYKNGKFYMQSDNDCILLDNNSEIQFINEKKKVLDANVEINSNDFNLKKLEFIKTPSLPLKEKFSLAFSNLKKLKHRTKLLAIPLFTLIILALFSLQSLTSAKQIDVKNIVSCDSRIYTVNLEKSDAKMMKSVHVFGFSKFYDDLLENVSEVEPIVTTPIRLFFTLPSFSQITSKKYEISGFSVLTTEQLNEEDLLYGRMPEKANEVVFEKWVLEKVLEDEDSTLSNFMNIKSFLNKPLSFKNDVDSFIIVGIADNNQNSAYFNKWAVLNFFPSEIKSTARVISYTEFEKLSGKKIDLPLKNNQVIKSEKFLTSDYIKFSSNFSNEYEIAYTLNFNNLPYDLIFPDEKYNEILKIAASSSYEALNVFCKNDTIRQNIDNYITKVFDKYNNGEIMATAEEGFVEIADYKHINIKLSSSSTFDTIMEPYILESNKTVSSRILITFVIILISIIIVFFAMKSYSIKNIYDIGVYRAIGIKKGSIVFVYALEILIISLKTTLAGGVLLYAITNIIDSIPILNLNIGISTSLFIYTTLGLITLNILIGILPIVGYLRLTPSQILSKYDI